MRSGRSSATSRLIARASWAALSRASAGSASHTCLSNSRAVRPLTSMLIPHDTRGRRVGHRPGSYRGSSRRAAARQALPDELEDFGRQPERLLGVCEGRLDGTGWVAETDRIRRERHRLVDDPLERAVAVQALLPDLLEVVGLAKRCAAQAGPFGEIAPDPRSSCLATLPLPETVLLDAPGRLFM